MMPIVQRLRQLSRRKFVQDVAILQVSGILIQGSQFISSVVIAYLLGAHGQGSFNVALMLQALTFFIVSVGLVPATVSQVAAASSRKLDLKLTQWLALLFKGVTLFSVLIVIVGYLALPAVGERWYGSRELGIWAWWLTLQPLLDLPRWIAVAAFQGTRRMRSLAALDNGQELLRAAFVIAGALFTGNAMGAIAGQLIASFLTSLIAVDLYASARKDGGGFLPGVGAILSELRAVPLRQGLHLGMRLGVIKNTSVLLYTISPRLLVGALSGMEWVAYFHIAQRMMGIPLSLMQSVTRNMLPALSQHAGRRDADAFRRLFLRASLTGGALIGAASLLFLPVVRVLTVLMFPHDYADPVFENACILVIGFMPFGFAVGLEPFYLVASRLKVLFVLTGVCVLVTLPINVLLIEAFPRTGAAWGSVVYMSWVLLHFAYIVRYFRAQRRLSGMPSAPCTSSS